MKDRNVSTKVRNRKVPRVITECGEMAPPVSSPVNPSSINPAATGGAVSAPVQSVSIEMDESVSQLAYAELKQEGISILTALAQLAEEVGKDDEKSKIKDLANQLMELI